MRVLKINTASLRALLAISFPMIVSQGAYAVMIFTDRYFMSMISPTHLAASLGGGGLLRFFAFRSSLACSHIAMP